MKKRYTTDNLDVLHAQLLDKMSSPQYVEMPRQEKKGRDLEHEARASSEIADKIQKATSSEDLESIKVDLKIAPISSARAASLEEMISQKEKTLLDRKKRDEQARATQAQNNIKSGRKGIVEKLASLVQDNEARMKRGESFAEKRAVYEEGRLKKEKGKIVRESNSVESEAYKASPQIERCR